MKVDEKRADWHLAVIPGRRAAASPESITTTLSLSLGLRFVFSFRGYGFRARDVVAPRNDAGPKPTLRRPFLAKGAGCPVPFSALPKKEMERREAPGACEAPWGSPLRSGNPSAPRMSLLCESWPVRLSGWGCEAHPEARASRRAGLRGPPPDAAPPGAPPPMSGSTRHRPSANAARRIRPEGCGPDLRPILRPSRSARRLMRAVGEEGGDCRMYIPIIGTSQALVEPSLPARSLRSPLSFTDWRFETFALIWPFIVGAFVVATAFAIGWFEDRAERRKAR